MIQRDTYYEESAVCARAERETKLYNVFKVTAIVFLVAAALVLSFAFSYVPYVIDTSKTEAGETVWSLLIFGLVTYFGSILLLGGAGLLFWFLKNRFNLSYDYLFVEDELRVAKIFNGKRRKYLKEFKADQILKLGKCENDSFERTIAGMDKKSIRFLTPNKAPMEGKEFYYLLYSSSIEKAVYILEARQELIEHIVFAAGRSKWESR